MYLVDIENSSDMYIKHNIYCIEETLQNIENLPFCECVFKYRTMKILPSNKKGGTDGAYYMFICWKQKEVKRFTFPTETSGRRAAIGQSYEQSRTPTYVGFGRAFIPATRYVF